MPTIQKLLHYKDMNSNREKCILINPYQCVILQKLWNSCSNWKLPVLWLADSTCTPGSKLPGQLIPAMFWKDQEWQSWGRWKGQFSFSHLHLFLSIVKESLLFYKHLSIFWSLLKVSFILMTSFYYHGWNHPTEHMDFSHRTALGKILKGNIAEDSMLFKYEEKNNNEIKKK